MAKVLVTESYLEDIADAIRAKLESEDTYSPSEMAGAIGQISGGATLISKTITENGTYSAADDSADGYSDVTVDVAGGGGGSRTYVSTTDPSQSQGHIGDYYIKYNNPSARVIEETTTRSYTLNITKGLRGSSALTYVGAHEIQLFYDDGQGNEVNIRTLPNFTYSCNRQSPSAAFDGYTSGNYWEANPTPVIVNFSATVPAEYRLKKFVVWQRQGSYNQDIWEEFTIDETINGDTQRILLESNLTVNDWAGAGSGTEWSLGLVIVATYAKIGETEATAQWVEAPIDVNIESGTALILLDKELTQSSGGSISIDETVTISEAGDYYIICYGYANSVEVYINGVLQSNNLDNNNYYYHAYSQKKTLSVGDIVRVNISSSGNSNLRAFIAAV